MITKNRLILILGIWIALIPFLGFPSSYKSFFVVASGIAVAVVSFLHARDRYRAQMLSSGQDDKKEILSETFTENSLKS